jgi:tetratricopeptide (TPR) repeat protein
LKSLEAADEALATSLAADGSWDVGLFEAMERILMRMGDDEGLMRLYARWLERKPPASVDHGLRVGLATALEEASPTQAIEVLEALVSVVPNHIPALRRLEHLQRAAKAAPQLGAILAAEAGVVGSRLARAGALWEVVALEEKVGAAATLDALARITRENPGDIGALDAVIRVASRLSSNVGVPHPALLAARAQLLAAVRVRRELTIDPLARAAYHLEEAALLETQDVDPNLRGALESYREALTLWPDSLLAARGLERLAAHMGDHQALIASQLALAKLTDAAAAKASHLVKAAELTRSHLRDERTAVELYEVALETDAESRDAAKALASMLAGDPRRVIDRLRPALERAQTQSQIGQLGNDIAQAYLRIHHAEGESARVDYGPGIQALRRAMRASPDDIPTLFVLARLYSAQKSWAESRDTLKRIVDLAPPTDLKTRHAASFAMADLFEGPLADPALAESTLVNVLSTEPTNKTALERLLALATKTGDKKLARSSLERLAEYETDLVQRTEYQLKVAEVAREANDGAAMLRALQDAVVSTPPRPPAVDAPGEALLVSRRVHRGPPRPRHRDRAGPRDGEGSPASPRGALAAHARPARGERSQEARGGRRAPASSVGRGLGARGPGASPRAARRARLGAARGGSHEGGDPRAARARHHRLRDAPEAGRAERVQHGPLGVRRRLGHGAVRGLDGARRRARDRRPRRRAPGDRGGARRPRGPSPGAAAQAEEPQARSRGALPETPSPRASSRACCCPRPAHRSSTSRSRSSRSSRRSFASSSPASASPRASASGPATATPCARSPTASRVVWG